MSRRASILLPAALCFACGDATQTTVTQSGGDPTTNVTADPSSTGSTDPTTSTTSTTSTTTTPTTAGEGSATDSGTSTGGTSTTTFTTGSSDDTGTSSPAQTDTGPQGTSSTGPDDTGTGDTGDSSTGDVVACACPDIEVALDDGIFLLSASAELWKYFPETKKFEMLGQIDCAGQFATFSMAVDRLGFAWVQFFGGELRKVDVTNVANCTDPGYLPGQQGVENFGMAFVSNSKFDACDRIYGNTYSGIGGYSEGPNIGDFLTITPDDLQLSKFGKTNFDGAEVTGTGDGRAFVFGGANPSKLVEMDKVKGTAVQTLPLAGLEINNGAFAFAFFGGDFYFFTDSDNDQLSSEVTHMDFDDSDNNGKQDLTVITNDAPLLVVGAGVSTCAPTVPL
jgi:hypothetical protein